MKEVAREHHGRRGQELVLVLVLVLVPVLARVATVWRRRQPEN